MKEVILIPSLDPDGALVGLVRELIAAGFQRILVIDDGSAGENQHLFKTAEKLGAVVCHHETNLGKGAAIKTGLTKVTETFPDVSCVITADGDGQHSTADIAAIAKATEAMPAALTIGSRNLNKDTTPLKSRIGNQISAAYFRFLTGISCADTQTGLRGIPRQFLGLAGEIKGDRYEYEMNVLLEMAQRKIPIQMIPIRTIYVDDNKNTHFRPVRDSLLVFRQPLRFIVTSLSSSVLDLLLFTLFVVMLSHGSSNVMAETAAARCLSGVFNFVLNKNWSFGATGKSQREFIRYLLLFFFIMLLSGSIVTVLNMTLHHVFVTVIKIFVDSALFLLSYKMQHIWVFRDK